MGAIYGWMVTLGDHNGRVKEVQTKKKEDLRKGKEAYLLWVASKMSASLAFMQSSISCILKEPHRKDKDQTTNGRWLSTKTK